MKMKLKLSIFAAFAVLFLGLTCVLKADAKTIATCTGDSTTFTGSISSTTISARYQYYTLKLTSSKKANSLYENVTLKSSSGVKRPSISAIGYNVTSISTTTSKFADGYYTMKGYYYYSVETSGGKTYTFSTTY